MATVPIPTLEIEAIRELSKLDQWVCFAQNKAPLNARTGHNASVENSKTWSSFDDACAEAIQWKKRKDIKGVGFVFTANDPYIGVDLDDCFNKDGSLKGWAHDIFNRLNSYTEKSPSGKGLHILIKGDPASLLKGWKNPKPGMKLEIYPFRRYFTVTGELLADSVEAIEFRDKEIKEILDQYWPHWSREKDVEVTVDHDGFDWNSQLDFSKMQALIEADQKFRQSWEKKRGKSIQDDSNSGYASSLAIRAVNAGWTDKEVIALIIQFYNKWGAINTLKRNPKKIISTIQFAKKCVRENKNDEDAIKALGLSELEFLEKDDQIAHIASCLKVNLSKIIKRGVDEVSYIFVIDDREVDIGNSECLISYTKTLCRILDATNQMIPKYKSTAWRNLVEKIIQLAEFDDSIGTKEEETIHWVADYLENSNLYESKSEEAIKTGSPFAQDKKIFFNLRELRQHILRERFSASFELSHVRLGQRLKKAKMANEDRVSAGKATARYWSIPKKILEAYMLL